MFQSTKVFDGFSIALRQHKAQHSHCCLLHGYSIYFHVTFEAKEFDELNWVQDFGAFKHNGLKEWLNEMFDHTLLLEKDDPHLDIYQQLEQMKSCKLKVMDKMGMEHLAKLVFDKFNSVLSNQDSGRVRVVRVECFEHAKNSAICLG